MFLEALTPDDLRQGDVLSPLVFPRWDLGNYQLGGRVGAESRANLAVTDVMMVDHIDPVTAVLNVSGKAKPLRFIVCSHDCEFDRAEIKNRLGILVAPLTPRPQTNDAEAIAALRGSRERTDDGGYDFMHLFPVQLPGEDDFVVADFSAMMAVGAPSKIRKLLIDMREHEMTDDARQLLRFKLAAFFGRPDEPEPHEQTAGPD